MPGVGKLRHVGPHFGDQGSCRYAVESWYRREALDQIDVLGCLFREPPVQIGQLAIQLFQLTRQPIQHPPEVLVGSAIQSESQVWDLLSQMGERFIGASDSRLLTPIASE